MHKANRFRRESMCGIVGFLGKKRKTTFLIDKLNLLEYRGYDSAGYAELSEGKIYYSKKVGRIINLKESINEDSEITCAIAHTRWATHGKVTETNSHPHLSKTEEWAIVHNGIIENYEVLKKNLKFSPKSDTDTAVIAERLEELNINTIEDFIKSFDDVSGSFGLAAICKTKKNTIFLGKRKSPLFISQNKEGDFLIASDPICFKDFGTDYYCFEDNEFAEVNENGLTFYNSNLNIIKKRKARLDSLFKSYGKNGYSTFMMKEIFDESEALKNQVAYYKSQKIFEPLNKEFLESFNKVKLIGCGTAYHASEIGAKYFQKILNIDASAEYASEFIYNEPLLDNNKTLFIFVSQSGETADTLGALKIAKKLNSTCICLTNVMYSSLARLGDIVLPVAAGVEVAVASTKAYTCQLSALYMLASHLGNIKNRRNINYFDEIIKLSDKVLKFDKEQLNKLSSFLKDCNECIFIGKDLDFITAKEASLKLKETTYINSSSYPSGELKHGYLALIEEGTRVFAIACEKKLNIKTINSVKEAAARGADVTILTNDEGLKNEENVIYFSEENEFLLPILSIAPIQYLSCKTSLLKGINPDQPRNLAKSVTVE